MDCSTTIPSYGPRSILLTNTALPTTLWSLSPPGFFLDATSECEQANTLQVGPDEVHGALDDVITGTIDTELIREQWDQLVRVVASLRNRTAPAHVVLRRLASSAPSDRLAKALTALGRALRSLYLFRYIQEEGLRARMTATQPGQGRHQVARRFSPIKGRFRPAITKRSWRIERCRCRGSLSSCAPAVRRLRIQTSHGFHPWLSRISPMGPISPSELRAHMRISTMST